MWYKFIAAAADLTNATDNRASMHTQKAAIAYTYEHNSMENRIEIQFSICEERSVYEYKYMYIRVNVNRKQRVFLVDFLDFSSFYLDFCDT